jgi:hypothetical protein
MSLKRKSRPAPTQTSGAAGQESRHTAEAKDDGNQIRMLSVSADESEQRFIDQLRRDPSLVSSELIAAGRGVFSRDDIASFVAARVTDPQIVAELCDLIETQDVNLVPLNLIAEAMRRDDLGVGEVWEPEAGGGRRPAAIHARGVTSLETAAAEMEEIAAANPRLRNPASDTPTNTMRLE